MSQELEQRVAILEAEVVNLKTQLNKVTSSNTPWWETIVGTFADNLAYDEAMQMGREYRDSLRSDSEELDNL